MMHNDSEYSYNLGIKFLRGEQQNTLEAEKWLIQAAQKNHLKAIQELAFLYENGVNGVQNYRAAAKWYEKGIELGDPISMNQLGLILLDGLCGEKNEKKAEQLFKQAISKGCALALVNLGCMYLEGSGIPQNVEKALDCFKQAAASGHVHAFCVLGRIYKEGRGVTQDFIEAHKWLKHAAESENAEAMAHLYCLYAEGLGIERDEEKALEWLKKAAEFGHVDSMYYLGRIYEDGIEMDRNASEAIKWFEKAEQAGHPDAAYFHAKILNRRSKFEGLRVFALVDYVEKEPLILNFHTQSTCKLLQEEANDPEIEKLRYWIRHPDRLLDVLDGLDIPNDSITIFEELIGAGNENEFVDQDGNRHIISPCPVCSEEYCNPSRFTAQEGYRASLQFLQKLLPILENQLGSTQLLTMPSIFLSTLCSEDEYEGDWYWAVYQVTHIPVDREAYLLSRGYLEEKDVVDFNQEEILLSLIEFCKYFDTYYAGQLKPLIDILESLSTSPGDSPMGDLWKAALKEQKNL